MLAQRFELSEFPQAASTRRLPSVWQLILDLDRKLLAKAQGVQDLSLSVVPCAKWQQLLIVVILQKGARLFS